MEILEKLESCDNQENWKRRLWLDSSLIKETGYDLGDVRDQVETSDRDFTTVPVWAGMHVIQNILEDFSDFKSTNRLK